LSTNRGAVPTTAEITPGTFTLSRKAKGGTVWAVIRNNVALEEYGGIVRWGEEFSAANGYAEGDSIRINFYNVSVVINSVTYEIVTSTGSLYFTSIRETGIKEMYAKLPTNYIMGSPDAADKLYIHMIPLVPNSIDLSNTVTWTMGISFHTNRGAVPTAAEITFIGNIKVSRKAKGGTSWVEMLNIAMSKTDGKVYHSMSFDAASGYFEGDSIRVGFTDTKITINSVEYVMASAAGMSFYTHIRETGVKEMYAKLPNDYIMGSSVQTSMDDEINNLITSTGHISAVVDEIEIDADLLQTIDVKIDALLTSTGNISSAISTIPTNPMLDTENGSSFVSIPDMAKESTVILAYTSTGNTLTVGFNAGAKEATLLEVQTSTGHISTVIDEIEIDADLIQNIYNEMAKETTLNIVDDKIDGLTTSTGHISTVVDEIKIDTSLIQEIHDDLIIVDDKIDELITSTGHISQVVDEIDIILSGNTAGSSTVIFTVQTSGGIVIQDASVQVWNTALTVLVTYGVTDANGQVSRSLNDGSYKVKVRKSGYGFNDPFDLMVSGNESVTYTGETYIPDPPASTSVCRIYGYVIDGSAEVMEGISVQFFPATLPSVNSSTGKALYPETIECTTNDEGYFQADLVINTDFIVIINSVGIKERIRIPDQTIKNLFELIGAYESGDTTPQDTNEDVW
jgi:hypothetical protein